MATYPGTVSPLRGLIPFTESERDVFFGRDRECEEVSRLVLGEGFRAGLLYGQPGAGKTSLLRAGVLPYLRDHGVVVLACDDLHHPIDSFTRAVHAATGLEPAENERPLTFLARLVGQSLAGQLYLFIIDEVDELLASRDERVVAELGDLFARVVARSGGRARFLFSCSSERVHLFSELERRTGSLFPPSARYELQPLAPAAAADVLERTLAYAGVATDPALSRAIIDGMGAPGPILPADLQVAMLAVRELEIRTADGLESAGGAGELTERWLGAACRATGRERPALRLLAELAAHGGGAYVPEWAAARASLDPSFAAHALEILADKGVARREPAPEGESPQYALAHEMLAPRVRELAAPARASARRAFELFGAKAAEGKRLSLREWRAVRREGLEPSTPAERGVLQRTRRFFLSLAGAIAAAPLVFLLVVYIALAGSYHLDVEGAGGSERLVARAGTPALESFYWLPHSPAFGSVVADTGLTRDMASEEAWAAIADGEAGQSLSRDRLGERVREAMSPTLRPLVAYAADGSDRELSTLRREVAGPDEYAEVLEALAPIARGGRQEVSVVEQALGDRSPAVRSAALSVAVSAERRHEDTYREVLAEALASPEDEHRRLAFAASRELGDDALSRVVQDALATGPEAAARRELFAMIDREGAPGRDASPASATSILASADLDEGDREQARNLLRRSFLVDAEEASRAAAALAGNDDAPEDERVFALELLQEQIDEEAHGDVLADVEAALEGTPDAVRAAALPVFARIDPEEAIGDLAMLLEEDGLSGAMREAMALAWGEVVGEDRDVARAALDELLDAGSADVRAAAARAYGRLGRAAQTELIELVRDARFPVQVGAAYGLANSAAHGGSGHRARSGIHRLWRERGRARRAAAEVYAHMAHETAHVVVGDLNAAADHDRDDALHPIGVEGLCNAIAAGNTRARQFLVQLADDARPGVRAQILECAQDQSEHARMAARIARDLAGDDDPDIRAAAARVLASVTEEAEDAPPRSPEALVDLAQDRSREVRLIALGGIANLEESAPEGTADALAETFEGADEAESLAILQAARAAGADEIAALGITDPSARVRVAAMEAALEAGANDEAALSSAITDAEPTVRRAALERIAAGAHSLGQDAVESALSLAIRDEDPEIGLLALKTLARAGDLDEASDRLERMLASRSERMRARAASAAQGLAERAPGRAAELLDPLLDDRSHDAREAALRPIALAYAEAEEAADLARQVRRAEAHPTRRIAAVAGLVARAETHEDEALSALEALEEGPPMAREAGRLGRGLVTAKADGVEFLALLLP